MRCTHSIGAPPASVCSENATWRGRCPAHGGVHPTTPELLTLLGQLTGWGDQSLSVDVGFKRQRVYDDLDDSHLSDHVRGFVVSTKILGQDHTTHAQGETLEVALWALCEEVIRRVEDIARRRTEASEKARDAMTKLIMQRNRAEPGR